MTWKIHAQKRVMPRVSVSYTHTYTKVQLDDALITCFLVVNVVVLTFMYQVYYLSDRRFSDTIASNPHVCKQFDFYALICCYCNQYCLTSVKTRAIKTR